MLREQKLPQNTNYTFAMCTNIKLQRLHFSDGHWLAGDYHWQIKNAFVPSRYKLIPIDGGPAPSSGDHKGFIVRDSVLRVVWGGEYYNGSVINFQFADYKLEHLSEEYDQYIDGLLRGYNGMRKCCDRYLLKQSPDWRSGYQEGRRVKLEEDKERKENEIKAAMT